MTRPTLPIDPARPDLVFRIEMPPSTNRLWQQARGRTIKTSAYRTWMEAATISVAEQSHGDAIAGSYAIRITVPKNNRDLGNHEKALQDMLQKAGVIRDDRLCERIEVVRDRDRERGAILAELWALPDPPKAIRKRRPTQPAAKRQRATA